MERFVALSDQSTLKGSQTEQILLNLTRGSRYELTRDQFDFLSLCDGSRPLAKIIEEYDVHSRPVVISFLEELKNIEAVIIANHPISRVVNSRLVTPPRLQSVHLEVTSQCNMRCSHCYQGNLYPVVENLTLDEIHALIEELQEMNVESVSISGGEPLLDAKTLDVIRAVEKNDMRVSSIFTNGLLLTGETIHAITASRSYPLLLVSLDAITPQGMVFRGFKDNSGEEVLKNILRNIELLVSAGIDVIVNTVVHRDNVSTLIEMYEHIKGLGISGWRIGFPKKAGFFRDVDPTTKLPFGAMLRACAVLLKHHLSTGKPFNLQIEYLYREELLDDLKELPDDAFVCDYEGHRESCCIKPNGDVVSCAYCNETPLGNIRQRHLKEIWHSSAMQKLKWLRIKDITECKDCALRHYCATGCRANAHFLHGDYAHSKDSDACQAVEFFTTEVLPLLRANEIAK